MNNLNEVLEIGKTGKLTYPELVDLLVKAGVMYYVVEVATRKITYFGSGEPFIEQVPGDLLVISSTFDESEVIRAIKRTQRKETNYSQFLEEIAKAGIYKYEVNLTERKIKYIAKTGAYEEQIPRT